MFDYKVIPLGPRAEPELRELGACGWRLVQIIPAYDDDEPRGVLERLGPTSGDGLQDACSRA